MEYDDARRGAVWIRPLAWGLALTAAAAWGGPAARAQISFVDMSRNIDYTQTSDAAPTTPDGTFIGFDLNSMHPGDFTSGQVTFTGSGSPVSLVPAATDPTDLGFQSGLMTKADMDAAYPTGIYTFTGSNSTTTSPPTTLDYTKDFYPLNTPALSGTTFSDLQGMDSTKPFTFTFNAMNPGTGADQSFGFLTIFDTATNAQVFSAAFLDPTTTSVLLPANTLTPGGSYNFDLDFSNRISQPVPGDGSAQFGPLIGFDVRTDGVFMTAAVPEPSSLALLGSAGLLFGVRVLRRRR